MASFVVLVARWTRATGRTGRVFLMVDHGQAQGAFYCGGEMIVVFAGPARTADDLICDDARGFATARPPHNGNNFIDEKLARLAPRKVQVVTNDRGLKQRLKKPYASTEGSTLPFLAFSHAGRIATLPSNDFLAMIGSSGLPLCTPEALMPLEQAEQRIRQRIPPNGDGDDALAEGSIQERTWHRVLTAELLRRCLLRAEDAGALGSIFLESDKALPVGPKEDEGAAASAAAEEPAGESFSGPELSSRERGKTDESSDAAKPSVAASDVDEKMRNRYIRGRRLFQSELRTLLWDHRIREDHSQRHLLASFVTKDSYFGSSGGGQLLAPAGDGSDFGRDAFIESWLCDQLPPN